MVSPLCAELVTGWIEDGTADATTRRKRRESAARQKVARRILRGHEYRSHPNGLYLWLSLPPPWTSATFTAAARRQGVAVTPSEAFRVDEGQAPAAVRVCLGAPYDRRTLEEGLAIVASVLAASPSPGPAIV